MYSARQASKRACCARRVAAGGHVASALSVRWSRSWRPLCSGCPGTVKRGVMLSGAINAVGHTVGKQPYENSATNLQSLALITAGEGLHNNHHAAPTSARFALNRPEFDPVWRRGRFGVKLYCAEVRHEEVHLKTAA